MARTRTAFLIKKEQIVRTKLKPERCNEQLVKQTTIKQESRNTITQQEPAANLAVALLLRDINYLPPKQGDGLVILCQKDIACSTLISTSQ